MTAMGTLASLTPILGWLFLPRILADALLRTVYSSFPAYRPTTQRQAQLHARAAHVLVVSCYLIYTFINAYRSVKGSPNFYALLDLEPLHGSEMDDEEWSKLLKATWRRLARSMHPDKIGKSPAAEAYFVQMRRAYETLSDPYTKIAYDRFGWTVIEACAAKCKTLREFVIVGLQQSAGFYIASTIMLVLLSVLQSIEFGSYWRYVALIAMFATEFRLVTMRTDQTSFPARLPYLRDLTTAEHILLLHQIFVVFSFAMSHIGPILFPASASASLPAAEAVQQELNQVMPLVMAIRHHSTANAREAKQLLQDEIEPILQRAIGTAAGPKDAKIAVEKKLNQIHGAMADKLCELGLRNSAEGRKVWEAAAEGHFKSRNGNAAGSSGPRQEAAPVVKVEPVEAEVAEVKEEADIKTEQVSVVEPAVKLEEAVE